MPKNTTPRKRPSTVLDGAGAERKALLAKLRRDKPVAKRTSSDVFLYVVCLIEWVLARDARYRRRKGGL